MSQLVILAGGLGTRLGPLTQSLPKPLVAVRGKPFLEWQLQYYRDQGFLNFLLLTGYKGEMIYDYFGRGENLGISINYIQEKEPLGTGGALIASLPALDSKFLMAFGDSFLPIQGLPVLETLTESLEVVMAVYDNREDTQVPFNVQVKNNRVIKYLKGTLDPKAQAGLTFVEAGVYGIKRSILENLKPVFCSFETDVLAPAIASGRVGAFESSHRFFDIGTPDRLKVFEERLSDYFPNTI